MFAEAGVEADASMGKPKPRDFALPDVDMKDFPISLYTAKDRGDLVKSIISRWRTNPAKMDQFRRSAASYWGRAGFKGMGIPAESEQQPSGNVIDQILNMDPASREEFMEQFFEE